jgi:OOP family OmpA-OmpF porin
VTEFQLEGGILKLPGAIVFETSSDKLSPVSDEVLEIVHDYLDAKPDVTLLRIEGHTDTDGNPAANEALSEKRAMAVARWLVAVGVKCDRLVPVGFGQSKPIVPNDTPDNKALNRRVAFVPAALRGKPIGGQPFDGGGKVAGDPCR